MAAINTTSSSLSFRFEELESDSLTDQRPSAIFQRVSLHPLSSYLPDAISKTVYDYSGQVGQEVLVDEPNFYLVDVPSGKPDPYAPCSSLALQCDDRPRVMQAGNKENTCWYYAYKTIRPLIGKNPSADLQAERLVERKISALRKALTGIYDTLPEFYAMHEQADLDEIKNWDKEKVAALIKIWPEYGGSYESLEESGRPPLLPELEKFLAQDAHRTFYSYMMARIEDPADHLAEEYIRSCGRTPEELYQLAHSADPVNNQKFFSNVAWQKLSRQNKTCLLNTYMAYLAASEYGLDVSPWSPFDPIDSLIASLREFGPHVIGGDISFDVETERRAETIRGRRIYTYDESPDGSAAHMLTIVGAKKDANGWGTVYYIDPADGHEPGDQRKIYSLSYNALKNLIYNLLVSCADDSVSSPAGYAWVANPRSLD